MPFGRTYQCIDRGSKKGGHGKKYGKGGSHAQ